MLFQVTEMFGMVLIWALVIVNYNNPALSKYIFLKWNSYRLRRILDATSDINI